MNIQLRRNAFDAIDIISKAFAYLATSNSNAEAIQKSRADHPDNYCLHESIKTRSAVVPMSNANTTAFNATAVADIGGIIGPWSAYNLITARALGVNLDRPQTGVLIPTVTAAADSVTFIAPAAPIPVKNFSLGSVTLSPHKAAAIVTVTREADHHSSFDAVIRALLIENVGLSIDKLMLDTNNTDGIRPAGLRYNVAATTSAGSTKMVEDLTTLAAAVAAKAGSLSNIIFVASVDVAARIAIMYPHLSIPVISTGGLASGTIIAMAVNALAVAASPKIDIAVGDEMALHMEDTSPAGLSASGTPNVVSAPVRSLWQTDAKALRIIFETDWAWRTSGAIAWMNVTWGA